MGAADWESECEPAEAGSVGLGSLVAVAVAVLVAAAEMARAARLSGAASWFGTGYIFWTEPSCEYVYWLPYTSWITM